MFVFTVLAIRSSRSTAWDAHNVQIRIRRAGCVAFGLLLTLTNPVGLLGAPSIPAPPCDVSANAGLGVDAATPDVATGRAALAQKDYPRAYSYFHPLAEAGNREAQRELGFLLMQSCYGDRSPALRWIGKAAEAGDVPAAATLGRLYMNGDGVAQSDATAFSWLLRAGKAGDASAQANLGVLYLNGRGVSLDRYQGIVWLVRAAEQGEAIALVAIARAYSQGIALPKDERRALFWMAAALPRASDLQRGQFATIFKNTMRQVSAEDARRIGREAQKWLPSPGALDDVLADAAKQRQFSPSAPPAPPQMPGRTPANGPFDKGKRSAVLSADPGRRLT
jgi:hypothetical protein